MHLVAIQTPLTKLLGIKDPIVLVGMATVSNVELAAAVSNAGGLGVIGGALVSPPTLCNMNDKSAPVGADVLIPKVGGGARKTK
jgi:NAD(P)H-dependent flavin oxidoreductase YrpB (nitropropane dioxygenase family)